MPNSFFSHTSPFIPGSLVRANEANAKFDGVEVGFDAVAVKLSLSFSFTDQFTGSTVIPHQTYTNRVIYINDAGDVDLFDFSSFALDVADTANNAASALAHANASSASETAAAASQISAAASAVASAASETNAAASASSASASALSASTSASSALTNATTALSARDAAAVSAAAALAAEVNAAASESQAASTASAVDAAKTAAEAARDAALASYDSFDDRYLGAKASDPALDNDGNALTGGTLYFNTTTGAMRLYNGTIWLNAYVDPTGLAPENHTHTEADITDRMGPVKLDPITTVEAQSTYSLTKNAVAHLPASEHGLLVSFNGVIQEPNVAFSITGDTITFTFGVTAADTIDFIVDLTRGVPVNSLVGNSITDLGDVAGIPSPVDGQALIFNAATGYWEPTDTLSDIPGIVTASVSGVAMSIDVNNDVIFPGSVSVASLTETSSIRYKENINPLNEGGVIDALYPVTYDRIDGTSYGEAGLIAEDVANVAPHLVEFNAAGQPEGVHYTRLIPYLIAKVQELEAKING